MVRNLSQEEGTTVGYDTSDRERGECQKEGRSGRWESGKERSEDLRLGYVMLKDEETEGGVRREGGG